MADCTFTISGPANLTKGQTATFRLTPTPDGAVCSVQWSINGRPIGASNTYAGLYVVQVGFDEIMLTARDDDPGATITARVTCRGLAPCGPTDVPWVVGTPAQDE